MSAHDIEPVLIRNFPCGMYESYSARIARDGDYLSVERNALDGITVLTYRMRGAAKPVHIELSDNELDALATMLREAYESQEREA